jgi:hypothetical protein
MKERLSLHSYRFEIRNYILKILVEDQSKESFKFLKVDHIF